LTEIAVEHWDCSHSLDDASRLLVVAEELSSDFLVSTTPQKGTGARKPPVPMPFGLSARSRPQKSQKRKQPKAFGACTRERKKARACESSDSDEEKRQAETSSSEGLPDTPNEEENMVPISQAAQNELVEVRRVESENVKLDEVKESLLEGDKEIQATQGGSFFSKNWALPMRVWPQLPDPSAVLVANSLPKAPFVLNGIGTRCDPILGSMRIVCLTWQGTLI